MRGSPPLLVVEDLRKQYPAPRGRRSSEGIDAVAGVSFEVQKGETFAVVGESGCGKSTLARTLLRLEKVDSGRVTFDGRDVLALDRAGLREFRTRVQIVFQDPLGSLNPRMRVGSVLAEVLTVARRAAPGPPMRREVERLLEQVGLDPAYGDALPHELSGGQRQRVGIARALAVRPELLVLDEPVSALDVSVRAQVVNLLSDLQSRHDLTYVLIAHDLALVEHVSDRVAVMERGRFVEVCSARDLHEKAEHPYTRRLLEAIPQPVVSR